MDSYNGFAYVYDKIMSHNVDYQSWVTHIQNVWKINEKKPELVLDLGCGTGEVALLLSKAGHDVIGIDASADMLGVAKEKSLDRDCDILFLNQDMTEFELYGTVDSIISVMDSVNYLIDDGDLNKLFSLANNYLNPKGLFMFDINTKFKYEKILNENNFTFCSEDIYYIWENFYDTEELVNEYFITFFVRNGSGTFDKYEETHFQRAFEPKEIIRIAKENNFLLKGIYDDYSFNEPKENSERLLFVFENNEKVI